jgi:hypothetical protein
VAITAALARANLRCGMLPIDLHSGQHCEPHERAGLNYGIVDKRDKHGH